jgi:aerobic carbon-monoxide dehydrogenase medium subunit
MIPAGFDYLRPGTIAEALEMASRRQHATFLAGGHALLPEWKLSRTGPATLIDLGRIGELHGIEVFGDGSAPEAGGRPGEMVRIGAMTTSAEIEYSADIARAAPLLPRAAAVISDPLIRNRATLGGSLAEASPSGDWPAVVLAADATILLRSRDSERAVPAGDFFRTDGAGFSGKATMLRRGELLTAVTVPAAGPLTRSTYLKRMHPASGHAMIGVAVAAAFDTSRTCTQCRVAITGVSTIATRAVGTEEHLLGSRLTADVIEGAANLATDGIAVTGDAFGSAAYLAELIPIYVNRALAQIAAPALEGDDDSGHDRRA